MTDKAIVQGGLSATAILFGSIASLTVKVIGLAIGFVLHIVLARELSVAEYGNYSVLLSFSIMAALLGRLSLDTTLIRLCSEKDGLSRTKGVLVYSFVVTFISCVGVLLLSTTLSSYLPFDSELLKYSAVLVLGISVTSVCQGVLRLYGYNIVAFSPEMVGRNALALSATFVMVNMTPLSLENALAAMATASVIVSIYSLCLVIKVLPKAIWLSNAEYKWVEWLKITIPVFWGGSLVVIEPQLVVLICGWLLSASDVAFVSVAARLSVFVDICMVAVAMYVTPAITRVYYSDDKQELQKIARQSAWFMFLPAIPILLFILFYGEELLSYFGNEYREAHFLLILLAVGKTLSASIGPAYILMGICREKEYASIATATILILIILCLFIAPIVGVTGIVGLVAGVLFIRRMICWFVIRRHLGISCSIL